MVGTIFICLNAMFRHGSGDALPIRSAPLLADGRPALPLHLTNTETCANFLHIERGRIDELDEEIARLVSRRALHAKRIAVVKGVLGLPDRCAAREANVEDAYGSALRASGMSDAEIRSLISALIAGCRGAQGKVKVAIQGSPGSWSDESLQHAFPGVGVVRARTVADAWRRVKATHAVAAWLAVHNSTIGEIDDTRAAGDEGVTLAEMIYPVPHALIAPHDVELDQIKRVEGHALAIRQCYASLHRLLPQVSTVANVDGAHGAFDLRSRPATAVLASPHIGHLLGLRVLVENVTDEPNNATTFQLIMPAKSAGGA